MKNNFPNALILAPLLVMLVLLTGCNNASQKTEAVTTITDSTSLSADTTKTATAADSSAVADTTQTVQADTVAKQVPLTLIINNLVTPGGPIVVGLYGTKNKFPDPKDQMKEYKFKPHGKSYTATINGLAFDTYAVALYQDVNDNGKIDKNVIGIPTEPYAFSKNYKPTVKAPAFKDCRFDYSAQSNTLTISMLR